MSSGSQPCHWWSVGRGPRTGRAATHSYHHSCLISQSSVRPITCQLSATVRPAHHHPLPPTAAISIRQGQRGASVSQLVRQSVCQSVSQSVSQSASQPVSQSVTKSDSRSISQPVSQPVGPLVNQSVSQSVSQSIRPPVGRQRIASALMARLPAHLSGDGYALA